MLERLCRQRHVVEPHFTQTKKHLRSEFVKCKILAKLNYWTTHDWNAFIARYYTLPAQLVIIILMYGIVGMPW